MCKVLDLVDGDAARLVLLRLGDDNGEDTILEGGAHCVLVHPGREGEAAGELANVALRQPVFGIVGLLLVILLCNLARFVVVILVFVLVFGLFLDCGLVGVASSLPTLCDVARGRRARLVGALDPAPDVDCLGLGEFDLDILLAHTGELAVEFVRIPCLADVELWLPLEEPSAAIGAPGGRSRGLTSMLVEVFKEAEERSEGCVGVVDDTREEGHGVRLSGCD